MVAGCAVADVRAGAKLDRATAGRAAGGAMEERARLAAVVVAVLDELELIVRVRVAGGGTDVVAVLEVGATLAVLVAVRVVDEGAVVLEAVVAARTREAAVGAVSDERAVPVVEGRVVLVGGRVVEEVAVRPGGAAARAGGPSEGRVAAGRAVGAIDALGAVVLVDPPVGQYAIATGQSD